MKAGLVQGVHDGRAFQALALDADVDQPADVLADAGVGPRPRLADALEQLRPLRQRQQGQPQPRRVAGQAEVEQAGPLADEVVVSGDLPGDEARRRRPMRSQGVSARQ